MPRPTSRRFRPSFERLEEYVAPAVFAVGAAPGEAPAVTRFESATGEVVDRFLAYDAGFTGGVKVALGDVTGDATDDVITGTGPGAAPHVKVFDGATGAERFSFYAFDPGFTGGVEVASGDVNGDGTDDIVVGAHGVGHVRVFDGTTGAELLSVYGLPGVSGQIRLATGDVNGDGKADVVMSGNVGGTTAVRAFDGAGAELLRVAPFPGFGGPVSVAAGDVDGDGKADVIAGVAATGDADVGGSAHVKVFSGATGAELSSFFAFAPDFRGGVTVGVTDDRDADGGVEIVLAAGAGAPAGGRVVDGTTLATYETFLADGRYLTGGVSSDPIDSPAPEAVADAAAAGEDGRTTGNLLANDTGVGPFTVVAVNGGAGVVGSDFKLPSGAFLTVAADGTFEYLTHGAFESLAAGETAADTFTYTIADALGKTATGTVTVTVTGANDAPTAAADAATTDEDTAAAGNVLANDTDSDATDTLAVTAVNGEAANVGSTITLASGALLTVGADGGYAYDPNGVFNGLGVGQTAAETFTYTMSDGKGGTATATVTLTVTGVNDAPVGTADEGATDENHALVVAPPGVLGNDADPDATDAITVTAVNGSAAGVGAEVTLASGARVTVAADGGYTYDPTGAFDHLPDGGSAADTFNYTAADGNGGTSVVVVTVTVTGVNDAPTAVADSLTTNEDTPFTAPAPGVLGNDSDPDAGDTFEITEVDGTSVSFGTSERLSSGALLTVGEDGNYIYDPDGAFEYLGAGETATDSFTYRIRDAAGRRSTATVTITVVGVNDAPTPADDAVDAGEDGPVSVPAAAGLLANDTDPDTTDTLTVTEVNGSAANLGVLFALPSGALLMVEADGAFVYDPNGVFNALSAGQTATDTFTYAVSDSLGVVRTATVTVTITGANDAPTAADDTGIVGEDGTMSIFAGGLVANDTDPDTADALAVAEVNGSAANVGVQITLASGALLTVGADGGYTYATNGQFEYLAVGEAATDSFGYTVSDGNGGTSTATVTITVIGANDTPTAVDDAGAVGEDGVLFTPAAGGLLSNDTDPDTSDSETRSVTEVNGLAANVGTQITLASGALLTVSAGGGYNYDPNGAFNSLSVGATATDSFTYTLDDGHGGTSTATATITVTGANDAPTAVADDGGIGEDDTRVVSAAGGLLTNDTDPDAADTLAVAEVNGSTTNVGVQITLPSGALLTVGADGGYTYDPNGAFNALAAGETATDSFTYTVSDGNGGTSPATVTITIAGANDAPTAADDAGAVGEDGALSVLSAVGLLSNDTDPDTSDTLGMAAANGSAANVGSLITLASGADLLVGGAGGWVYDPNGAFNFLAAGETATDSFTYTVSDGNGGTSTATVTVTITGANDAPTAADDTGTTNDNAAATVAVIANDTDPDTADALFVSNVDGTALNGPGDSVVLASGATVTRNADGTLTYDPTTSATLNALAVGATTTDSFSYTVSDGNGGTSTATATMTVTGANDAPAANDDTYSLGQGAGASGALTGPLANDTDPENHTLTITAMNGSGAAVGVQVTLPSGALLTLNSDGSFVYDPNGVFVGGGVDSFQYTVSDGNGGTDTGTVTVFIAP